MSGTAAARGRRRRYLADAVVPCDEASAVHRPGVVDVEDGRIIWVGPADGAPAADGVGVEETRLRGLLLPGLVNVHCHSPMTLLRGAGEGLVLDRWLREVLWPREALVTEDDVYWGMTLACAELLRFGVTTSCEMYVHEEALIAAVRDAGSRCVVTGALLKAPGWERFGSWETQLARGAALHDRHAGADDRVEVGFGPHAAYTLPVEALTAVAEAARERDALLSIHVAESREEGRDVEARHGMSVPALLAKAGVFDGRVLTAHSVWLTDDDLELYRRHDVAVAHCPTSNAKLASGIARLPEMLALGLRVGLGTDGPASNNDLDLWEDMRLAALLARLTSHDAAVLPAPDALALATRGGAAALGRDDIGTLAPGCWADMVLVDLDDPGYVPVVDDPDLITHTVWSASSRLVTDVWVAGRRVVAEGRCLTVDAGEARAQVQRRAERLAGAAGDSGR
ncbi:MAG: amidohydrolase [Solirubrobacterales bacterium]|nr:amidohydrolase [Solirubrobacterales bacterium]